jgi:hypothetical protein
VDTQNCTPRKDQSSLGTWLAKELHMEACVHIEDVEETVRRVQCVQVLTSQYCTHFAADIEDVGLSGEHGLES